jgi:hypothetical protein
VSFRDRTRPPEARQLQDYEIRKAFQRVFGSDDGRLVLDFLVQRICGVDAIVKVATDAEAREVLTRKNVGLTIWQMSQPGRDEAKIEVMHEPGRHDH